VLLDRLHQQGSAHDARQPDRSDKRLNITPETGRFLDLLIGEAQPRRIIEVGTSNGYSTIWIARAARRVGATFESIDIIPQKTAAAVENLAEAGLLEYVLLRTVAGTDYLSACPDQFADFVFLDSDRSQYVQWWPSLRRILKFGTLIVDNAISHADELADFQKLIAQHDGLDSIVLPIGKGQMLVRGSTIQRISQ
jgi:predicted O-methyltransferase YrrM